MNKPVPEYSIAAVAGHFGVPISTLHFWERQGLLTPHRRSGRRYYSHEQMYRIALIHLWRSAADLGLADIAAVLDAGADNDWRPVIRDRMVAIRAQQAELAKSYAYLEQLLGCRADGPADQCAVFRATVAAPEIG